MHVNGAEPDERIAAVAVENRQRPFDIDAELRFFLPCRHEGMGLIVDVRVDAKSGLGLGARCFCLHQLDEVLQLLLRLDIEVSDAGIQSFDDLPVGLAHTGVNDFGRIAARLKDAIQLSAADDVKPAAQRGHEPKDVHVAARFNGETDGRLQLPVGLLDLAQMVLERGLAVDVRGGAGLASDALRRNPFDIQLAIFVAKEIHRLHPSTRHFETGRRTAWPARTHSSIRQWMRITRRRAKPPTRVYDRKAVTETGGIGTAEGFADGGWANHRQSFDKLRRDAALAAATHNLMLVLLPSCRAPRPRSRCDRQRTRAAGA
jgi:hypothetical protein